MRCYRDDTEAKKSKAITRSQRAKREDKMAGRLAKIALAGCLIALAAAQPAAAQTRLTVMVFQGVQNLPLFAAQTKGFFARRGLEVELKIAPTSDEMRNGLAEGRYQIVHGAIDNAVAMAETAKADIAVINGGDNGWNQLIVQADIGAVADLRGKTVIVDAPNTAYALQLYELLARSGLKKGDYEVKAVGATFRRLEAIRDDRSIAASMLNPPFSTLAEKAGLKSMGSAVKAIGPYQATGGFVMQAWAKANEDTLVKYLQAYIEGVRWTLDPANKEQAIRLLMERLKLPEDVATQAYAIATDPAEGFAKDSALDLEGFRNVLKLRAVHLGTWGGVAPVPEKYIDLSYYQKAMAGF
jgi:ABC-type nitrate/sulfonate/bicarbonate transport system substrate-binding protein